MTIKSASKRPQGLPADVHLFKDDETGKDWHAQVEYAAGDPASDTHMVVIIHVAEANGIKHDGTLSYSINSADLADPDFSPERAVEEMIARHIKRSETIRKNKAALEPLKVKFKPKEA